MILISLSWSLKAQDGKVQERNTGKFVVKAGVMHFNNSWLNGVISFEDFSEFSNVSMGTGLSFWVPFEKLYLLIDVYTANQHQDKVGASSSMTMVSGGGALGYDFVANDEFAVVPYLGFATDYIRVKLVKDGGGNNTSVEQYLQGSPDSYELEANGYLLGNIGMYACWNVPNSFLNGDLVVGFHGAYMPRIVDQKWNNDAGDLDGGSNGGSASVNVVLGFSF